MKSLRILALIAMLSTSCVVERGPVVAQGPPESYQVFYNTLSPYGQWVVYGSYGYVWIPSCGPDFMPYGSMGYWVYTNYGWTWCSEYPWGWAPFHYGFWGYDDYYGWYWVPGHVWGPAWVMWREYPGYYGWAPLGPDYVIGVTVYSHYYIPPRRWVFIDHHHFGRHDMYNYYGPRDQYDSYIKNSSLINNYSGKGANAYYTGPKVKQVEQYTGTSITQATINQMPQEGQSSVSGNKFNIYRPSISSTPTDKVKPAPSKVYEKKDVAPINQRPAYNPQVQPVQPQQPKQDQRVQPQPKTQPQPKVQPPPQPKTQPQPKVQPPPQPKSQPKVQPQPKTQPRTQPRDRIKSNPQPRTQPKTQPRTQPKTQPRTQPHIQSQPRSGGRRVGPDQPSNKVKQSNKANTEPDKKGQEN